MPVIGTRYLCVRGTGGWEDFAHLVFIYNPTPRLFVLALMEPLIFHNLVDRYMCKPRRSCELLGVCGFAYTGRACYDYVRVLARHGVGGSRGRGADRAAPL